MPEWGNDFAWEVIELLGQGVTILDSNGRFEYVNPIYARMAARPPETLPGMSPLEIIHPDDHETFGQAREQNLSGKHATYEARLVRPNGALVYTHVTTVPHRNGETAVKTFAIITDLTELKQAEAKTLETQAQLTAVFTSAMDAIITINEAQHIVFFNDAAEQMFGADADAVIGQPLDQFIPERFRTAHRQHIRHFGQTGVTSRQMGHLDTLWALKADGSEFPIEASISQAKVSGLVLYTVILRDITVRKRTEKALRQNETRYRSVVEDMPGFLCRFQPGGIIEFVNAAYAHTFEQQPADMIGQSFLALIPEKSRAEVKAQLDALTPESPIMTHEHPVINAGGQERWQRWTNRLLTDVTGQVTAYQSFGLDITEHKQAEEALRQSEAQLQHIIDTVPEGVLLLDSRGQIHLANPIAERFLTRLAPERKDGRLTHLGKRPLFELLTSPPKGLWHEITGDDYAFETIARPIEHSPNNTGWVLVLRDVTQERDIQRRIQQQERLAAVGQLASGIAHDFNNIMAVIILYAQIISRTIELPPRTQESLNTIEKQAQRAVDLIQQILDFSRQSVMERHLLDLQPFMKELVNLFKRTLPEHINIQLTDTGETYFIHADPSRIQQVMMNLAFNARDAMPEEGTLNINLAHIQTQEIKRLFSGDMPPGSWIQIQVSDSGSGIPPEQVLLIFEPFFTTKEVGKGTGLGLAQVYGIMQQHDGYVDVASKVGQGTTMTLYFPVLDSDGKTAVNFNNAAFQQGSGETVLLVEDDTATRSALRSSLALMNYEVIEVKNGREALAILETKAAHIALVLSDVVMPEMGGIALFHAIRQKNLKIPLVLLTGHPLSKEMENMRILGLAGWLSKPPDLVSLSQLLAQVMDAYYPP